nr:occlusion-derived virus envelope protein 43 [Neodiprion sertifer nucleopolyhedrovirus]
MSICSHLDQVIISDEYLFPSKNLIVREAENLPITIPKSTSILCVIVSIEEDIEIIGDVQTGFSETLITTQHDDGVLDNVVVVYLTPIQPITTYGILGTFVFSGFLTNFLYDCKSAFLFKKMISCPVQEPLFYLSAKYHKIDGDNILGSEIDIDKSVVKKFNVCFRKRPIDLYKIVLNVKRLLIILSRYRNSSYILNLNDKNTLDLIKTLKYEQLRRMLKFQQIGGLCGSVQTDETLSQMKIIQSQLHSHYDDMDNIMKTMRYYQILISQYHIIPEYYKLITTVNEGKYCGISVHCNNFTITSVGVVPPNIDICTIKTNTNKFISEHDSNKYVQDLYKHGIYTTNLNIKAKTNQYYWS